MLEDWGLDPEAAAAWSRLTGRERRTVGRRTVRRRTVVGDGAGAGAAPADAALLGAVRAVLVRDDDDEIVVLEDWPAEWIGQPFDVRDAPTRRGPGVVLGPVARRSAGAPVGRPGGHAAPAPGLDPTWATTEPTRRGPARGAGPTG